MLEFNRFVEVIKKFSRKTDWSEQQFKSLYYGIYDVTAVKNCISCEKKIVAPYLVMYVCESCSEDPQNELTKIMINAVEQRRLRNGSKG